MSFLRKVARGLTAAGTLGISEATGLGKKIHQDEQDSPTGKLSEGIRGQVEDRPIDEEALRRRSGRFGGTAARARRLGQDIADDPRRRASEEFRARQTSLADALGARAAGQAPSVAEQQFAQSREANMRAALAQAASARGVGNAALQQRQLGQALSTANLGAAQQAATLRAAEQAQAEQTLGQLLGQGRAADVQEAQQQIEQDRIRGTLQAQFEALGLTAEQSSLAAEQALEELMLRQRLGVLGIDAGVQQAQQAQQGQVLGGLLSAGGAVLGGILGGPPGAAAGAGAGKAAGGILV